MTQCVRNYETFSEDLSDDTYERYSYLQERKPMIVRVQVKKVNGKLVHQIVDKRVK